MLQNIAIGQYVPGQSFLHRADPRSKLLFIILFATLIFLANNTVTYAILIGFTLYAALLSRLSLSYILKSLKPVWILILFTVVLHIFITKGGTVYFQWGWFTVEEEGVRQAIFISLRLGLLILISSLLTLTTSPIDLTEGLERLLGPLGKIGIPVHDIALMMSIALRFIPTLMEETDKIIKAQTARGANFTSGSLVRRAKNLIPIAIPLFVSAFRRAEELALAMEARGYRGGVGRTRLNKLTFTWRDGIVAVASVILVIVIGWWRT
ncbi:energy-coupling factor transporter transmembrane protein EcfT [Brevibacillus sp. HB1.4B]|uniref:Energy-coupling factor transporter transmembrane protein EcfT n=1 Tax=Brevibacillus porteri TaxID=2126350 RepID=A0ABX5FM52_9BACL|nr:MULTISPECIES: energy-coupling factor transporter transmembrane component T [Brevibacillus]MDC0765045.1 energy-coupling factor transporter transmembrane component T [Brevibacillus sp. AG]MED1800691.1 energy-coupling factor transporter transmembrane component T [Brevibacillus porteri]MED2133193.1 energy-coupling factor transporter transmembrane component T [Brevibacillus porteri]MED2746053.1 energy-coupling factor transporter transmembrane component T [Brevibacillus porteri]MED2817372.1 energ